MMPLPDFLLPFEWAAQRLLQENRVGEIEFSGGTYQVQVFDPEKKEDFWPFMQFDDRGRLKDHFCSCEEGDCVHITAAFLKIFSGHAEPLHIRFEHSLWNQLGSIYADKLGDEKEVVQDFGNGTYEATVEGNTVFKMVGKTAEGKEKLRELFSERVMETEETSLKFSNLSDEELRLWRQGRPSLKLKYELSFWNEMAKWLMFLQDQRKPYQIQFSYSPRGIPTSISIHWKDVEFWFMLSLSDLVKVIPTLAFVESPLPIYGTPVESIEEIRFDKESGHLLIVPKNETFKQVEDDHAMLIGDWIYRPRVGFYSQAKHPLLAKPVLKDEEIAEAFDQYFPLFQSLMKTPIHKQMVTISYEMGFDQEWNLHIKAYLFKPGDLSQRYCYLFRDWAYLDGKGFYHLEGVFFHQIEVTIPFEKVGDFVREHRGWLSQQKGFQTHITGIETKLSYEVTDENCLLFHRKTELGRRILKDFGSWIYVKGEGFFSKVSTQMGTPITTGVEIKPTQVPLFIRMYREELQLIHGFFSDRCPVKKAGLNITMSEMGSVTINPEYELYPDYMGKNVRFFEDYTYVDGEGFYRLPQQILLPERYRYRISLEKESLARFLAYEIDHLREYAISIDPRLEPPIILKIVAEELRQDREGYLLSLSYRSEKGSVNAFHVWQAFHAKEHYLFSQAGLIDLTEDRFSWLKGIKKSQVNTQTAEIRLSSIELLRLQAYDPLLVEEGKELLQDILEFRIKKEPDFSKLKSVLRPYQVYGLHWLWFLYQHNLSGLLCDEMGLGKTHQAMAFLAAIKQEQPQKIHFLIVCPTSVIYHWEEKLQEYLPSLRVCTFHGTKRSFKDFHKDYDVLLTSYGILRNEKKLLTQEPYGVAIFDEIQAAKNQTSRIHSSLLGVKARVRIGLTGTPIENRLRELKSLFDIILPHYMPPEKEYQEFFVKPIEKQSNLERRQLLSRFISPFILRRKKADVLLDLPEKIEEIVHCELEADQHLLYTDVLRRVRSNIIHDLQDQQSPIPYIHIFSALSSLKQICNHPAAYLKTPDSYKEYTSGKWNLFVELFSEAQESEQKIVIFSQYLAMLDIFELFLQENHLEYATIRGATIDRGREIERFNRDPNCTVFVGSLGAAGLGIDLTAGSVVIHYDRWWNAAREDQATDRVHRIGQTRGVQVFKLVTKGTFEERIDEMISRKGELMEEVVGVDDHQFMKRFNREELIQLLMDIEPQ